MRTGNTLDGMYFLLLVIPFLLSFWIGDHLRTRIASLLALECNWNQHNSALAGVLGEITIILAGIFTGFLLVCLV
jgi:hypothetical protein